MSGSPRVHARPDADMPAGVPGRRRFLLGGLSAALVAARPARADLRVGLLNPPGPLAPSMLRGAKMGAAEAESLATMFGKTIGMVVPDVAGPERLAGIATGLVKDGVSVLVGGGDTAAAESLREVARDGKALFMNVGCAADRLRSEGCDRHTFHVHASLEMHAGAAAFWLGEEKKLKRWALLTGSEDVRRTVTAFATARGASIVEDVPAAGATDWSPALERLRAAQAEAVWLGLPADQAAGFLPRYAQAGLAGELIVLAPDGAVVPGAASGVWPLMWHHTLDKYSARELNNRHRRGFQEALDGVSWSAWAALKMIGEGMLRQGTTPQALLEYLESDPPFDGHKGRALTFRKSDHQLRQPLYLWRSGKAGADGAPAGEVAAEVPRGGDLDAIFLPSGDGGCLKP